MGKTFNRIPLQFDTPSGDDINLQTFSQINWKGIIENKNTFGVDQESFEDCNNIYVDENIVLTSRPETRQIDVVNNIEYHKTKSYIILYDRYNEPKLRLISLKNNVLINREIIIINELHDNEDLYFYELHDTLYVFGSHGIYYIDADYKLVSGLSKIYIPYKGDVKNLLLPDGERYDELLDGDSYNSLLHFKQDSLRITVDNTKLSWPYDTSNLKYVLLNKTSYTLTDDYDLVVLNNIPHGLKITGDGNYITITLFNLNTNTTIIKQLHINFEYIKIIKTYLSTGHVYIMPKLSDVSDLYTYDIDLELFLITDDFYNITSHAIGTSGGYPVDTYVDFHNDTVYFIWFFNNSGRFYVLEKGKEYGKSINVGKSWSISSFVRDYVDYHQTIVFQLTSSTSLTLIDYSMFSSTLVSFNSDSDTSLTIKQLSPNPILENYIFTRDLITNNVKVYSKTLLDYADVDNVVLSNGVYNDSSDSNIYANHYRQRRDNNGNWYNDSFTLENNLPIASYFIGDVSNTFIKDGVIWLISNGVLYTNAQSDTDGKILPSDVSGLKYNLVYNINGQYVPIVPNHVIELDNAFLVKDNISYLLLESDGQLYMPENKHNNFYEDVTNLTILDEKSILVQSKNSIWKVTNTGELDDKNLPVYVYSKTKLNLNTVENSETIVAYDGATILIPTYQGLAALSYNQIVSVQEQIVSYLSNNIYNSWLDYVTDAFVKFTNYKYYLFVYSENSNLVWVYDYRFSTWWKWSFDKSVKLIANLDNYCFIGFDDSLAYLDNEHLSTNWFIKSQKLHLNAPVYNKSIRRFLIHCNGEQDDNTVMNLQFTNYRKRMFEETYETIDFDIDFVRTYVNRLNYTKVLYFQYKLSNNEYVPKSFKLTGINIDYKIGGKIR